MFYMVYDDKHYIFRGNSNKQDLQRIKKMIHHQIADSIPTWKGIHEKTHYGTVTTCQEMLMKMPQIKSRKPISISDFIDDHRQEQYYEKVRNNRSSIKEIYGSFC